jgi:tetratricopeptide (TPR) repeat protein
MQFSKLLVMLTIGLISSSCTFVSALGTKEAQIHYQAANNFEAQGDYVSAREQYWKALVAARSSGAGPGTISMLTYEFGRTTGYACHFDESEKFLLESLRLEESLPQRNSRNIGIRLFELARLMYDQKRYKDAVNYYSKALIEVEQNNAVKSDPIAFAGIYEEYGNALEQSGEKKKAEEALRKAKNLRETYPDRKADFKPVRYKCDDSLTHQSTGTR